jgi:signal transduction histidine kinase
MKEVRLADFIRGNMEPILRAWEDFARTIEPPALAMDDVELRDHAAQMLTAFADDLDLPQSEQERITKSHGRAQSCADDTAAESHAEARLLSGYTVVQLVSEYRALRSSVLALWSREPGGDYAKAMADMTRFNEAVDQALAESVARYEKLVKHSQNMFLAILGHDLRNPLGTLVTGASFIMQACDIEPKYVLVATRMFSSAQRMSKLIGDLIDYTRTHLGSRMSLRTRHGSIVAVCREVVDELRTYHPERRIELESPRELEAVFDDGRVAQMLSNLVGNAVQHGSAGAPVVVRVSGDDDGIVIAVNNRGPVIPAEKLGDIFDPLVRIASHAGGQGAERTSLGIGLFVSREIVHAHGGSVEVASNAADGTTFTVTLPRGTA